MVGNVFAPRFEAEEGTVVHGDVAVTGRLEGAEDELEAFVRSHGDARRFLGRFRGADSRAAGSESESSLWAAPTAPGAEAPIPGTG